MQIFKNVLLTFHQLLQEKNSHVGSDNTTCDGISFNIICDRFYCIKMRVYFSRLNRVIFYIIRVYVNELSLICILFVGLDLRTAWAAL